MLTGALRAVFRKGPAVADGTRRLQVVTHSGFDFRAVLQRAGISLSARREFDRISPRVGRDFVAALQTAGITYLEVEKGVVLTDEFLALRTQRLRDKKSPLRRYIENDGGERRDAIRIGKNERGEPTLFVFRAEPFADQLRALCDGGEEFPNELESVVDIWCQKSFGPPLEHRNHYRAYAQVDVTEIPRAVRIIQEVAEAREKEGKPTHLKFLLARIQNREGWREAEFDQGSYYGWYVSLNPHDAVIVFYADQPAELREVLEALSQREDWREDIEAQRSSACRRKGVGAFFDSSGRESRSLCVNDGMIGYSEDVVDKYGEGEWRKHVVGTPTQFFAKRGRETIMNIGG